MSYFYAIFAWDRQIHWWNRLESSYRPTNIGSIDFQKCANGFQWESNFFSILYHKQKYLNIKARTIFSLCVCYIFVLYFIDFLLLFIIFFLLFVLAGTYFSNFLVFIVYSFNLSKYDQVKINHFHCSTKILK